MGIDFCVYHPFLSRHKAAMLRLQGVEKSIKGFLEKKDVKWSVKAERQQTYAKIDKLGRVIESYRKEEISSTEFPEGVNTISTKEPLTSQQGEVNWSKSHWFELPWWCVLGGKARYSPNPTPLDEGINWSSKSRSDFKILVLMSVPATNTLQHALFMENGECRLCQNVVRRLVHSQLTSLEIG